MMISRIEFPLHRRLRAPSYPEKKLPLPRDTGNSDNLPDKRATAQEAVVPGSIARTLIGPDCKSVSEKALRQLESLLSQKLISNASKPEDLFFNYKDEKLDQSGLPIQFIKDLNRSELSITVNGETHQIKSAKQYKNLLSVLSEENKKLTGIISAISDQGFFADNYKLLYERLPEGFSCSNSDPYKVMVSVKDFKEGKNLTKVVTIRGEIEYEFSLDTDNGDRAKVKGIRAKGVVEKVFSDSDIKDSKIKFDAKSATNLVEITPIKRDRATTQPAISLKDKTWISKTNKSSADNTYYSTESTSIVSEFEPEDEGSMPPIPKIISSDAGFMKTDTEAISLPSVQSSKSGTKPSVFARIRQAWSDITDTVVSWWQRIKRFISF